MENVKRQSIGSPKSKKVVSRKSSSSSMNGDYLASTASRQILQVDTRTSSGTNLKGVSDSLRKRFERRNSLPKRRPPRRGEVVEVFESTSSINSSSSNSSDSNGTYYHSDSSIITPSGDDSETGQLRRRRSSSASMLGSEIEIIHAIPTTSTKLSKAIHSSPSSSNNNSNHEDIVNEDLLCNLTRLLNNQDLLAKVCQECIDLKEFPSFIYRFFESHHKELELMRWAISKQLENTTSINEIFRNEGMAVKLFHVLFFNEDGRPYLFHAMAPLIFEILAIEKSLEIEPSRVNNESGNTIDIEKNCKWLIDRAVKMLHRMNEQVDLCPLLLRESLLILKEEVAKKFPAASEYLLAGIIFLRFLCPSMVFPEKYKIVDIEAEMVSPNAKRGLILASKILQSVANGADLEPSRPHADLINQCIRDHQSTLEKFLGNLLAPQKIEALKREYEPPPLSLSQKQLEEDFGRYLREQYILKQDHSVIEFHERYTNLMDHFENIDDFKLAAASKSQNLFVYQRRVDNSSHVVFKSVGKFRCPLQVAGGFLHSNGMVDKRVFTLQCLNRYDDWHSDWYMTTAGSFPVAPRDWIYTLYTSLEEEHRYVSMSYSIERADVPTNKKYTRGDIIIMGSIVEQDPTDPNNVIFTSIHHVDPKGSLSSWITAKEILKSFKKLRQHLEHIAAKELPPKDLVK